MSERLKRAEIRDGKICLEGRVLKNPEFLDLKVVTTKYDSLIFGENLIDGKRLKRLIESQIEKGRPVGADAYILGQERVVKKGELEKKRVYERHDCVLYLNSRLEE